MLYQIVAVDKNFMFDLLMIIVLYFSQESCDRSSLNCAVDLIKFFTRLYRHVPEFTKFASFQEFVEALASTLFPPPMSLSKSLPKIPNTDVVEQDTEKGFSEWVSVALLWVVTLRI